MLHANYIDMTNSFTWVDTDGWTVDIVYFLYEMSININLLFS